MHTLKFQRLVIVSHIEKSARQFKFQKRFNLITARENNVGKSSLAMSLVWALGCDPDFANSWSQLLAETLIEFEIGSKTYKILRKNKGKILLIEDDGQYQIFDKISGDYSETFSQIVNFPVKLRNKNKENPELEVLSPSYYFMPFYIDQLKGWASAWANFKNLTRYENWQNPVIKYHTGYTTSEYFEKETQIFSLEKSISEKEQEIKKSEDAINLIKIFRPKAEIALSDEEFEELRESLNKSLHDLYEKQKKVLFDDNQLRTERYDLVNQVKLAQLATKELEDDYLFSVECIEGEKLECPLCGTVYDNSIVSRSSILLDKQRLLDQIEIIEHDISTIDTQIEKVEYDIKEIKNNIKTIKESYTLKYANFSEALEGYGLKSIQNSFKKSKDQVNEIIQNTKNDIKNQKLEQRRQLSKNKEKELNNFFIKSSELLLEMLGINNILDFSKIKSPQNWKKFTNTGGAANQVRTLLAYHIAVLKQIYKFSTEIPAPLIIDTPNQHEQNFDNYRKIINIIISETPEEAQVILCGMEHECLDAYKIQANVIDISSEKLLITNEYSSLSTELKDIWERTNVS